MWYLTKEQYLEIFDLAVEACLEAILSVTTELQNDYASDPIATKI